MNGRHLLGPVLVVYLLIAAGCAEDPAVDGCTTGEQTTCGCTDGQTGIQVCEDDGTYGPCNCPGLDAGIDDANGADDGDALDARSEETGDDDTGTVDTGNEETGTEDTGSEDTGTEDTGGTDSGTEEDNCTGIGLGADWTRDTTLTEFDPFPPPSGNWETFTLDHHDYFAVEFTIGENTGGKVSMDRHTHAEDAEKTVAISECPGDFSEALPPGNPDRCRRSNQALAVYYSTESDPELWDCQLTAGTTYYLNIAYGTGEGNALTDSCPQEEDECGAIYAFYY